MRIFSRIVAFWWVFLENLAAVLNPPNQNVWFVTFWKWSISILLKMRILCFQKIRQIKAWYYRIDLTNPLRSYNGLNTNFDFNLFFYRQQLLLLLQVKATPILELLNCQKLMKVSGLMLWVVKNKIHPFTFPESFQVSAKNYTFTWYLLRG